MITPDYQIMDAGNGRFVVTNPAGVVYQVWPDVPLCECPDFAARGKRTGRCKHIEMAMEWRGYVRRKTDEEIEQEIAEIFG